MTSVSYLKTFIFGLIILACSRQTIAQTSVAFKLKPSEAFAGVEVGSKGVKMTILEITRGDKRKNQYKVVTDSTINTDFINFNRAAFDKTLDALNSFYNLATKTYNVPANQLYTVISSGVQMQADKDQQQQWIDKLQTDFVTAIADTSRKVDVITAADEARLSHLGIVPAERRFTTFLIDIGSGNTKGGYFFGSNPDDFKIFNLNWGTKTVANAAAKRAGNEAALDVFERNVYRVISGEAEPEVVYNVNLSNAFNMSDYVAFSGGIAWATASMISPELTGNPVIPVTYNDVLTFREKLVNNYASFDEKTLKNEYKQMALPDQDEMLGTIKTVKKVFDQRSMLAGTALLLDIMRQFDGVYEKKQFYLVKNGQTGWISAYVNQTLSQ